MSQKTELPVTNQILQVVQEMSDQLKAVDHQLKTVDHRLSSVENKLTDVDNRLNTVDNKLTGHIEESKQIHEDILFAVNVGFSDIEARMVTKDEFQKELEQFATKADLKQALAEQETRLVTKGYLDEKLSHFEGKVIGLVRKEDHKVNTIVSILHQRKVLSGQDLERVDEVHLFPKVST